MSRDRFRPMGARQNLALYYKGRYTRRVLLPEHDPGSIWTTSTHEGAYCGSLLYIIVHTREQTKATCFRIADIHQTRAWKLVQKLKMATYLRSRSKKKKLIILMMMKLEEEDSTTKQVARKTWERHWLLRRQEKGLLAVPQAQHFRTQF